MRKGLLIIAAALMLSVSAFAQWDNGGQGFQRPDEATMIKMRTDRMVQELGLNETQAAKLLELNQKYPTAMMGGPGMRGPRMNGRRDGQGVNQEEANADTGKKAKKDKKAKKNKKAEAEPEVQPQDGGFPGGMPPGMDENRMKEIQDARVAYENELKEILTEDQYKTYQENKNRRPQGRGPGGPGGFGPGGPGGGPGRGGFGGPGGAGGPGRGGFGGGGFGGGYGGNGGNGGEW